MPFAVGAKRTTSHSRQHRNPKHHFAYAVRAKAVRLVREHAGDYPTEYAAITAVAGRLGMSPETLRLWIRQDEIDSDIAPGQTTGESREVRELRRKARELEETIEILKAAAGFMQSARLCGFGVQAAGAGAARRVSGIVIRSA